jgi:amino acid adenylation domain-containing protein
MMIVQERDRRTTRVRYRPVHTLFEDVAAIHPDAVALVGPEGTLLYRELNERANQLAHYLLNLGVAPGMPVGLCLERSLDMVIAMLGILKANAAYLPLNPDFPLERLSMMIGDASPGVVLTDSRLEANLPTYWGQVVLIDAEADRIADCSTENPATAVDAEGLFCVIYTSGSTGQPKGTLIPHRAVPGVMLDVDYARFDERTVLLQHCSSSWDASIFEICCPLLHGGRCVLMPAGKRTAGEMADVLRRQEVNTLFLTNALFNMLVDTLPEALAGVDQMLVGGEVMSMDHLRRYRERFPDTHLSHVYGPSECTVFTTAWTVPRELGPARTIPIGTSVGDRKVYILDASLNRMPIGVPGELCIGGPAVALGYLNRDGITASKFVPNPYAQDGYTTLYRSGDVARFQPDGTIEFLGRMDRQVKLRGFRIELEEVELAILAHPGVREAAVALREDQPADKRLVAYVTPNPRFQPAEDADTGAADQQVEGWASIFDEHVYAGQHQTADPLFNTTGWSSSYDGTPIPDPQMRIWAGDIVAKALEGQPQDVLELGCGTGMLLFQIAPRCRSYVGYDISAASLDHVRQQMSRAGTALDHVTLVHRAAHEMHELEPESLDLMILSSVVQYFPDQDYLRTVLERCLELLRPGGRILLADLRNLEWLELFHASVQLYQAETGQTGESLGRRIREVMERETELLVAPAFFAELQAHNPRLAAVHLHLQRGVAANELNRFRYHAILQTHPSPAPATGGDAPLDGRELDEEQLRDRLARRPERLDLRDLPNERLCIELLLSELLRESPHLTAGELRSALADRALRGIDPERCDQLAEEFGYRVRLSPAPDPSRFDACFLRGDLPGDFPAVPRVRPPDGRPVANQPLKSHARPKLIPELRRHLGVNLPDFMVPSAFVLMESLPRTAVGKVDHAALPKPGAARPELQGAYVAPQGDAETVIANQFTKLLNLERVGRHDNFFELGGHSLLATQLASRLRSSFRIDLPLRKVFEGPTVAELALYLVAHESKPNAVASIAALRLKMDAMSEEEVQSLLADKQAKSHAE